MKILKTEKGRRIVQAKNNNATVLNDKITKGFDLEANLSD